MTIRFYNFNEGYFLMNPSTEELDKEMKQKMDQRNFLYHITEIRMTDLHAVAHEEIHVSFDERDKTVTLTFTADCVDISITLNEEQVVKL